MRDSGRILFGIGFNHRQYLKSELQTDFSRKRGLRSFVGIVVEESEFNNLISIIRQTRLRGQITNRSNSTDKGLLQGTSNQYKTCLHCS